MYYVITATYKEPTALQRADRIVTIPGGAPAEARFYQTKDKAMAAHPDKPILTKDDYKKLMGLWVQIYEEHSLDYIETLEFKDKYSKRFFGRGYKAKDPRKSSKWKLW